MGKIIKNKGRLILKRFDANKYKYSDITSTIGFDSILETWSVKYSQFKCSGLEQKIVNCYHKISNNDTNDCKKNNNKYYYATTSCESTNGK